MRAKMINKILCFMWGHTYKTNVIRVDYQYIFMINVNTAEK